MNLKTFLTAIDNVCIEGDKETLHLFIRELARDLPEEERDDFYKKLVTAKIKASKTSKNVGFDILSLLKIGVEDNFQDKKIEDKISKEVDELVEYFSTLDPKKAYLDSVYNEFYDYRHHNHGELDDECEFFFKDHFDLIKNIKKACDAVHQCYEYGKFEKGWPLVEKLLNLEVKVKGSLASYHGVQSLFFKDFSQYQLVPQRAISEVTYAVVPFIYFNFDEVDRILVIVSLLLKNDFKLKFDFSSLKDFQNIDLKDIDEFYKRLIQDFINQELYSADTLIYSLFDNLSSKKLQVSEAKKYLKNYPRLMKRYVDSLLDAVATSIEKSDNEDDCNEELSSILSLIIKSLPKIQSKFGEKEDLIEQGILFAKKLKRQKDLENLCLELFSLRTNPVNYLKLRYYSDDYHKYHVKIQDIYETYYGDVNSIEGSNICGLFYSGFNDDVSENGYRLMRILDGRVIDLCCSVKRLLNDQSYKDSLFYKGLLLGYILLSKKESPKQAYDFVQSELSELFTMYSHLDFGMSRFSLNKAKLLADVPSSKELMKLWLENTSIQNNYEDKLFSAIDVNFNNLIESALTSKRSSLYADVACWIVMLFDLYKIYQQDSKKAKLIDYIVTNHSGKKVFLRQLSAAGINLI